MDIEIKKLVDDVGASVKELHENHELNLKKYDVLLVEKEQKINANIDAVQERMEKLEAVVSRGAKTSEGELEEKANPEYRKGFIAYLRKGQEPAELKALSVGSDPDGGYLVTPQMSTSITKIIYESSPIRQLATVQTISTDTLEILEDNGQLGSGWTGETDSRAETTTPTFGKKSIPVMELYAEPRATQKLIDDANLNMEQWIANKAAEKFGRDEATAFVSGNGVARPRGFLTYAAGTSWGQIEQVNSGTSAVITADGLVNLVYTLKEGYAQGAAFLMKRASVAAVRLLKDTTNQYIWQPGLAAGQPDSLLGYPVYKADDMPVAAASSLSVAFGNFRAGYTIVDRVGIRVLRDAYTAKPYVKFYTTKRVGGDVSNFEAIKLLKLST